MGIFDKFPELIRLRDPRDNLTHEAVQAAANLLHIPYRQISSIEDMFQFFLENNDEDITWLRTDDKNEIIKNFGQYLGDRHRSFVYTELLQLIEDSLDHGIETQVKRLDVFDTLVAGGGLAAHVFRFSNAIEKSQTIDMGIKALYLGKTSYEMDAEFSNPFWRLAIGYFLLADVVVPKNEEINNLLSDGGGYLGDKIRTYSEDIKKWADSRGITESEELLSNQETWLNSLTSMFSGLLGATGETLDSLRGDYEQQFEDATKKYKSFVKSVLDFAGKKFEDYDDHAAFVADVLLNPYAIIATEIMLYEAVVDTLRSPEGMRLMLPYLIFND